MSEVDYDFASAFAQIEKCDFECEAGPLANNTAYRWLKNVSTPGPKFRLGQWVWFRVDAEVSGIKLSQWVKFCVVGITLASDTERQTYKYDLSTDPPQAYHYGSGAQFRTVAEEKLWPHDPGGPSSQSEGGAS